MIALRAWISLAFAWLFCLYNVERIHGPINLSPWLYVFATVAIVPIVALRLLHRPRAALSYSVVAVASFLMVKYAAEGQLLGRGLPITVTELLALTLTLFLGWQIANSLEQFERGASHLMLAGLQGRMLPLEQGQGEVYRELRRARRMNRPLTVVTLQPHKRGSNITLSRLIREAQRRAVSQYIDACVADVLANEIDDCGTILQEDDRFIVVLPETTHEEASMVVSRLKTRIESRLGLDVSTGVASFPDEEITFVGLLEKAQEDMRASQSPSTPIEHSSAVEVTA